MYTVVQNGDMVTIPVIAKNNGTGIEPNAKVVLTIPTGMSLFGTSLNKGTYDSGTNTWNVGQLKPGDTFKLDATLQVDDLGEAPFVFSYTISGDTIDPTAANNTKTHTINQVSAAFNADAVDDNNSSLSFDVSVNDTKCELCDTKWVITNPSVTNLDIIAFDETTGKGEARLDDPTVNGTFEYAIICYNCGDGQEYIEDTANVTIPALFDNSWIPAVGGDVSVMTNNPSGIDADEYEHDAGGIQTVFDTGRGRITSVSYNDGTGIITINQKDGTVSQADISDLLTSGEITGTSFPSSDTLRITQKGGNQTDINLSAFSPVTNSTLALQGVNNETLRLTDSDANFVDGNLSPIVITAIDVDESAAPTKVIELTFADASTLTASFTDDTSAGGGDNWGTQVVQSNATLLGDGTGGNLLGVDPANNALVSNLAFNGTDDLVLTLTDGTTITITNAALKAAIDTNTTELTNAILNGQTLEITDDNQTWSIDLSSLVTTSLAWSAITSKPTLTQDGGNVTGFINLDTETFALTAPNDDNYVDGASYAAGTLTLTRTGVLGDLTVDLSSLEYTTSDTSGAMATSPYNINMGSSDKHVQLIPHDPTSAGASVTISVANDVSGATLVIHNDENETFDFNTYFREPDLSQIGSEPSVRNTSMVFDVIPGEGENTTANGNILIRRQF